LCFAGGKNIGFYEWRAFSDKVLKDSEQDGGNVQQNVKADLNKKKWRQFWKN